MRLPRILRRREHMRWAREHLVPWLGRRAMGRSSGDGREPKRPELKPFQPPPWAERGPRERGNGSRPEGAVAPDALEQRVNGRAHVPDTPPTDGEPPLEAPEATEA